MISSAETSREKDLLPFGWGRFAKAIDRLADVSESEESLLAACVTLNPAFKHRAITLVGILYELKDSTNVVLAVTNQRLLVIPTSVSGAPGAEQTIAFAGLELVAHDKREITLRWSEGEASFKGAAKTMVTPFLNALRSCLL